MYYLFNVVKEALDYINEHYNENLDCNAVAEKYAYSEYHFHRIFKNITNISVTDYIRDRRLFAAANKLLDISDETILDICLSCGFDNQRTFNRAFRQKFGLSPKEFRIRNKYVDEPTPDKIINNFYYRLQEGGNIMLKPYIVEKGVLRFVGRCSKEGGVNPSPTEGTDKWLESDEEVFKKIPNTVDDKYYGISINFANGGDGSRRDYWSCKEVSSYFHKDGIYSKNSEGNWGGWEKLGANMETLTLPATRWLYIPIRFDDPFVRNLALLSRGTLDEVMADHSMDVQIKAVNNLNKGNMEKKYENPDAELGTPELIPPVYLWGLLWLKENGYERQDYPFELEIYGLRDGYDSDKGGPGADMTLAIPMI